MGAGEINSYKSRGPAGANPQYSRRALHNSLLCCPQEERRNLAINLWYESSATDAAARLSSLAQMFQAEGCHGEGGAATQGGLAAKEEL
jgi:hypothetical protein